MWPTFLDLPRFAHNTDFLETKFGAHAQVSWGIWPSSINIHTQFVFWVQVSKFKNGLEWANSCVSTRPDTFLNSYICTRRHPFEPPAALFFVLAHRGGAGSGVINCNSEAPFHPRGPGAGKSPMSAAARPRPLDRARPSKARSSARCEGSERVAGPLAGLACPPPDDDALRNRCPRCRSHRSHRARPCGGQSEGQWDPRCSLA